MLFRPSKKDIIIAANRKANALLQEEQEAINKRRSVINEHIKVVRQKIDQHLTRESGKCHKRAIRKLTTIAKNMGSKINVVSSRQVEELKTAEAAYDALSSESNKVYQAMTSHPCLTSIGDCRRPNPRYLIG